MYCSALLPSGGLCIITQVQQGLSPLSLLGFLPASRLSQKKNFIPLLSRIAWDSIGIQLSRIPTKKKFFSTKAKTIRNSYFLQTLSCFFFEKRQASWKCWRKFKRDVSRGQKLGLQSKIGVVCGWLVLNWLDLWAAG